MWAPWISVISSLPLPVNVFVLGEEEIEQLKGSHVHDDIKFIRELARDWFEMYANEPHVTTQIGAVSQKDFMVACALVLSRAQLVPPVPSLKGAQFGIVPFADFLKQGRESSEVVEEAQVLGPTGQDKPQWPVANMALREAEDSLELRRDMRAAFNMPPEKQEEECVFLEASRDVELGKCLFLAASANQDNAELLLTYGLVSEEDATTIKFRTLANDTWTTHNEEKLGETRYRAIISEVFRIASHFIDLQHPDLKEALPDILWTLPSLPRGLHLLQRSIFPFICVQTKDFDVGVARDQLRALLETKLASYSSNDNMAATGMTLIEWEKNLIRRYLSLLNTLDFNPVIYADNIVPESADEKFALNGGEEDNIVLESADENALNGGEEVDVNEDIDEEFENFKKLFEKTR